MSSFNTPFTFGAAGAGQGPHAPVLPNQHQPSPVMSNPISPPQQAATQQNVQLPGIDMSALAGISPDQVALIARLLQSGALLPPPPPPGASAPLQQVRAAIPSAPPQHATPNNEDGVDTDKEEGQLEESELKSIPQPHEPLPSNAAPRDVQNGTPRVSPRQNTTSRQSAGANSTRRPSGNHFPPSQTSTSARNGTHIAKEKQSKDFVLAMHQAGYTYQQLAAMVQDPKPLRRMFRLLGLPVSSDYGLTNGTQTRRTFSQAHSSNAPGKGPVSESLQTPAIAKAPAPPKPVGKTDRSAYLAKLQALKAGKAGPTGTQQMAQSPAGTPSTVTAPSAPPPQAGAEAPVPTAPSATISTPTSKAVKTELARQRLEAFKAERAAKQQAVQHVPNAPSVTRPPATTTPASNANNTVPPNVSPADGLGAGLNDIATRISQRPQSTEAQEASHQPTVSQQPTSPSSYTPSGSFAGLPGLFTNSAPQVVSPAPQQERAVQTPSAQQQATLPAKRSMAAASANAQPQLKRPFGQSRSTSEDESFIIENSDDEDEDSRMEVDAASTILNARFEPLRQGSTKLHASSSPAPSHGLTLNASGAATPSGMTYEQKLKAIEELNRRIAEKESKSKAPARPAVTLSGAGDVAPVLPGISTVTAGASTIPQPDEQPSAAAVTPGRPASAAAPMLKQQREDLRQRIAELESARRQAGARDQPESSKTFAVAKEESIAVPVATVETPKATPSTSQDKVPAANTAVPTSTAHIATTPSEDGEVDDESDFDFYGDEDDVVVTQPAGDQQHVDSQATTGSVVTNENANGTDVPGDFIVDLAPVPSTDLGNKGVERGDDGAAADVNDAVALTQHVTAAGEYAHEDYPPVSDIAGSIDEEAAASAQAQPTTPDSDVEMSSGDSDSDDSNVDDSSDLNGPFGGASVEHGNTLRAALQIPAEPEQVGIDEHENRAEETALDDIESSDASSTRSSDSDEYEPEPANVRVEDATLPEPETVADDLASELQPNEDQQTAAEPVDQVRSTFDWLHAN